MSIDLKALGNEINKQDNRCTRDPLFVVFQKREIVVDEDYDYDFLGWYDEDGHRADSSLDDKLNRAYRDIRSDWSYSNEIEICDDEEETTTWKRLAVKEVDEFVTACFTEQGCKNYIVANGHNLNKPFIFASSLYRNHEMIGLRDFFLSQ
jgi:hypothetical protein